MRALVTYAWAHLRGDWRRTVPAAVAVLLAVTSFVVLTGSVRSQRLVVTEQVASNYRSTYDILVRPARSATGIEQSQGVVRPNFLSGRYGGISLDQVHRIAAIPGVGVAAPVAVLGQTMRNVLMTVDVGAVLHGRDHAMVRYRLTGTARNGTATTTNQDGYLYLTRSPLTTVDAGTANSSATSPAQVERRGGRTVTACMASDAGGAAATPATAFAQSCWSAAGGGGTSPRVEVLFSLPLTVEAIDPQAEAELTGLDRAVVDGRALTATDASATDTSGPAPVDTADAVMASQLPFDFQAALTVQQLSDATSAQVLANRDAAARRRIVLAAVPVRTVGTVRRDAAQTYRTAIATAPEPTSSTDSSSAAPADQSLFVFSLTRPGDVAYRGTDPLTPAVVPFDPAPWRNPGTTDFLPAPSSIADTGYRPVTALPKTATGSQLSFRIVGRYDPDRLPRPSRLNEVPLETYRPSAVEGADAASKAALGDRPLLSDLNSAGYVQSPPALLVPLAALPLFERDFARLDRTAPVSSVRVRVAGINGLDAVSRERVRQVADTIHTQTGLDVDITIGASLQNRRVTLPGTTSGTPPLLVDERWTKKGVAVAIAQAIDIKSLVLFLVVLISAALTVALIATATVQARRRELATLACLGWRADSRRNLVGTELLVLGLGAGALGALASWPVAAAVHTTVLWWQSALAVPLGAMLALVPGLTATLTAGRIAPLDAFRPPDTTHRRSGPRLHGPITLGLVMTSRRPARTALGSVAVALAVASSALLTAVVRGFHGAVVGSFLGDAVALQVRAPDIAAAVLLAVLGLTAVTTVLLLAVTEDAPALAALSAIGWTDAALTRTLATQAAVLGLIGSALGVTVALIAAAAVLGSAVPGVATIALVYAALATGLCVLAALIPALIRTRTPAALILTRD